jgi:hypothetical protein
MGKLGNETIKWVKRRQRLRLVSLVCILY